MAAAMQWELRNLRRAAGLTASQLRAIEKAEEAKRLPKGSDLWHQQVFSIRATEDLDSLADIALSNMIQLAPAEWLKAEAKKEYRLGESFLQAPLHLMGGIRVGIDNHAPRPQRLARMLLTCQDHLKKRDDVDFFEASMLITELAVLGNSIPEIVATGEQALTKFGELPSMDDDLVASTIFELLVGAACIRRGLDVRMVKENKSTKVPDFRIVGKKFGSIPAAIECKRRLGLSKYELEEARTVQDFYESLRQSFLEEGIHCSLEVSFGIPISAVSPGEFIQDVLAAARRGEDLDTKPFPWGTLALRRLPYCGGLPDTRLYSPEYLRSVFGWEVLQSDWDGLLCGVEAPSRIRVGSFRMPNCLKWRSESEEAMTKKARGISSLWGDAIKQIPDGDIGFLYIAYPEGGRPSIADARTRNIIESMEKAWHRWSVRVPVVVIDRLYPRPVGVGSPDLIESSLPAVADGQEHWLTHVPWLVFTRQFEQE